MHQFYMNNNGIAEGPYSAHEILSMNLPLETMILDSESGEWHPLSDYNMEAYAIQGTDEAEEFLLNSAPHNGENTLGNDQINEASVSDDYQQYIDSLYKYTAEQMIRKNVSNEDMFRDLVQQGVPVEIAKTIVDNMAEEIRKHENEKAGKDVGLGILSLVIGLIVTAASYSSASAGGSYVIATGAIIYGIIQMFRGIFGFRSKKVLDNDVSKYLNKSQVVTVSQNYSSDVLRNHGDIYEIISKIEKMLEKDDVLKTLNIQYSREGGENTFTVTEDSIQFHLNSRIMTDEINGHIRDLFSSFEK